MNSGVHYWEVYCPNSPYNIDIGIIKKGWSHYEKHINKFETMNFKIS